MNEESIQNSQEKGTKNTTYDPTDFRIEFVVEENHDKYMEFFKEHFLTREQISVGLHVPREEFMKYYSVKSKAWMYDGLSTCAIHTPTNELAGLMINQILTRDEPHAFLDDDMTQYSQKVRDTVRILGILEESTNLFADPNVAKIIEISATVVAQMFSGNKLTYRLAEVSENRAIELGCQVATSQSSSIITQHIRKKMGYEECYSIDYATFELDGKKVFDCSVMNGTTAVKVLRKYLRKK